MIPGLEPVTLITRKGERDPATGRGEISETRVAAYASIQPANGATMERLPEGFRISDVRILYMGRLHLVKTANPKTEAVADQFEFEDSGVLDRWTVQVVPDWRKLLPHYEVVVTRELEDEDEDS